MQPALKPSKVGTDYISGERSLIGPSRSKVRLSDGIGKDLAFVERAILRRYMDIDIILGIPSKMRILKYKGGGYVRYSY